MKNKFIIDNSVERLLNKESTDFLMPNEVKEVSYRLKKYDYKVFMPYKDADKVILYGNKEPKILLYQIITKNKLRHQDILGSLFDLGINNNSFGDIIILDDKYYFYVLPKIQKIIENNLTNIGSYSVEVKQVDYDLLKDYEKKYETFRVIVPSTRLDVIIGEIIKSNRAKALDIILGKNVIVNYEIQTKKSYILKENDIFSIRKYGKYKFIGVINKTKKERMVVEYQKYL